MSSVTTERSKIAHAIRVLAVPIVLAWLALTVVTNVFVPSLEKVAEAHTVSMNAHDAPAFIAMQRIGANFQEFDSDSNAMVILEGDQPLGEEAHHYYDELIKAFRADTEHVEHVADFWGDPLTAAGAQSSDGKSAYVQIYLRGNMGETRANESIAAVREIIAKTPSPPGVKSYVTGGAALGADQRVAGDKGAAKATMVTLVVIFIMLLVVYRSIATTVLILLMVFVELGASRGIVAFLANAGVMGLSTFATSLLTLIAIAAGTDYAIFSSVGTRKRAELAKTGKPRTTPCFMAPPTWCLVPDSPSRARCCASNSPDCRGSRPWRCRARSAYSSRSSPL